MNNTFVDSLKIKYPKLYFINSQQDDLQMKPEKDDGFIEYKRSLLDCNDLSIQQYATQMQWRILQNTKANFAIYYVGIDDNGSIVGLNIDEVMESIESFVKITNVIDASITFVNFITISDKTIIKFGVKNKKLSDAYLTLEL